MSNDKKETMKFQELLDHIDNLQRNINVLNTTVMYLGMAIDPEKLKKTVESLRYESTNNKFDRETQKLFSEMAEGIELRRKNQNAILSKA